MMDYIVDSLSKKYKQLQKEADAVKTEKSISDDEHDELTKAYEEKRREEARLLLTGR